MAATATADKTFETTGIDVDADAETTEDTETSDGPGFSTRQLLRAKGAWERQLGWDKEAAETKDLLEAGPEEWDDEMQQMMRTVQMIGGAVIGIAIVTIVVNEVLTTQAVNNSTGPFGGVINSLETTGVAAMSLLVVGLLVAAASKLMSFFGGGF